MIAEVVLLTCLGLIAYVYFLFPGILWLLSRFVRESPVTQPVSDSLPTVSLLVTAHDEERVIAAKIENCRAMDYPSGKLQIVVISDGSTDRTNQIVDELAGDDITTIFQQVRTGKTDAINRAIDQVVAGDIVVFNDANTFLQPEALQAVVAPFIDPTIGAIGGLLHLTSEGASPVSAGERAYWSYENALKSWESRIRSIVFTNGGFYAIRRALLRPVPPAMADDFVNPVRAVLAGYRVLQSRSAHAYEKTATSSRDEYRRRVRIVARDWLAFRSLIGPLAQSSLWLGFQLVSHKLLRWMVGLFLAIALVTNLVLVFQTRHAVLGDGVYLGLLWAQGAFYVTALVGYLVRLRGLFKFPSYFCLINSAATIGLLSGLLGRRVVVWQHPNSSR